MEVKPGYKQTDVGVIPDSWTLAELQKVCREQITYGIVQCGPHVENGVPYIRVSDMNTPELDVSGMLRTSPAIAAKFSRSRVEEGDIVYALRGKIGEVRRVGPTVAGANLTQGTARLSPNNSVRTAYLLWALRSQRSLRQAALEAKGSTFREITLAALRRIQLPIPSPAEQEAIAEALGDTDALIESLEQLIAKKRQIKQGTMQELLTGKKRLPGFSGAKRRFKQTEVGGIPEDWKVDRLGNYVTITSGESPSGFDFMHSGTPFFKVDQLNNSNKYQTETPYHFRGDKGVEAGSIIFPKRGASIMLNKVRILPQVSFMDTNLMALTFTPDIDSEYAYYALTHIGLWRIADTTSIPQINNKHIDPLPFPIPPLPEQRTIAAILSDMDAEIDALEAKLDKTRQLKQGMMHNLLTGTIRLV